MPTIFDFIMFIVVSLLSWKLSTGATMPFTPEQRIEIENALEYVETLMQEQIEEHGWADFPDCLEEAAWAHDLDEDQIEEAKRLWDEEEEANYFPSNVK